MGGGEWVLKGKEGFSCGVYILGRGLRGQGGGFFFFFSPSKIGGSTSWGMEIEILELEMGRGFVSE